MRSIVLTSSVAAITFTFAGVSHAQSATGEEAALEEITITAEKREQTLQKTAISVTAVTGEQLANAAKSSIDAALQDVPAVQVQGIAQGGQIFIRGVGSSVNPTYADPAVALMLDGVYTGRSESVQGSAYDIARVEVLRGPQGTLYGRNASGGSVNVITNNPDLTAGLSGAARLQAGNYNLRRGEAAVNLPINDAFGIRIAASKETRDGYISDGSSDAGQQGARIKILYKPIDSLSLLLKYDYFSEDGHGPNSVPVSGSAGNLTFPPFLGPYTASGWVTGSSSPWDNDPQHSTPPQIARHARSFSLQLDADLGFGTLTFLPAYSKLNLSQVSNFLFGNLTPAQTQKSDTNYRSAELRLASPAESSIKWLLGAYYLRTQGRPLADSVTNGPYTTRENYLPGTTSAVFGQATLPISDTFRLTGGLRWSRDKTAEDYRVTATAPSYDSGSVNFNISKASVTYKAGLEYDLLPQSMLYAHVATGFKQGGLSRTIPPTEFKPETLTSYEVGIKNRFLGDTLQLNGAVFYYNYDNYQLTYPVTTVLGSTSQTANFIAVSNAEKSTIFGGELELDWLVTPNDQVRATFAYLDAEYGRFVFPNNPFVNQGNYQLEGRQMANSPQTVTTLAYERRWQVGDGNIIASADTRWSSSYYATPELYLGGAQQDSYTRSNAQLRYSAAEERWSVGLWAKNLENKAQSTYVYPAYRRFVTAPRTYGVNAEVRF